MQSNNPVFRRSEAFNGQVSGQGTNAYGNQTYPGNGATHQGYGQASGYGQPPYAEPTTTGRPMTVDSVVQKTGLALAVVIVFAALTWWFIGDVRPDSPDFDQNVGTLYGALMIGSLGAFGLSMVNSFKRVISPALVIAFCALEGVALGALSKFFDVQFGDGIVTQAVIGTFAAFAGTLAAYKFFNIQVGSKFRTFVIAAMFGMVGLGLLEI